MAHLKHDNGQVDFTEMMETENGNGNTETETRKRKHGNGNTERKNCVSYSTTSKLFVHSWLGCYMLGRGETEFCSFSTHLIVQSISSPFEHCVFHSVVEH